ncbi:unnamed protein product [Schistosoma margrebowiei]|uniref:Uncharacterized protein n=1 Tax=Schistosoma margrebowiei TaxID=48269 RepID=A0A3P8CP22_9TREM|nr:unnamed protein product [Schistosoma margrebowiei]
MILYLAGFNIRCKFSSSLHKTATFNGICKRLINVLKSNVESSTIYAPCKPLASIPCTKSLKPKSDNHLTI